MLGRSRCLNKKHFHKISNSFLKNGSRNGFLNFIPCSGNFAETPHTDQIHLNANPNNYKIVPNFQLNSRFIRTISHQEKFENKNEITDKGRDKNENKSKDMDKNEIANKDRDKNENKRKDNAKNEIADKDRDKNENKNKDMDRNAIINKDRHKNDNSNKDRDKSENINKDKDSNEEYNQKYNGRKIKNKGLAGPWNGYDPIAFENFYKYRPFTVLLRATSIFSILFAVQMRRILGVDIKMRATKFREGLIRLGPFFVKLGQALSTRPDIMPPEFCTELSKLQDQIPPYPTHQARDFLEQELGASASRLFKTFSNEPLAAASLGQVYKAQLHSGEFVAVKIQRPKVVEKLALDAYLLRKMASYLDKVWGRRSDLVSIVDEMVGRVFEEVDYMREGKNAEKFAKLYSDISLQPGTLGISVEKENSKNNSKKGVKVPKIFWSYTSRGVLTMEWINGIKLTDKQSIKDAKLNTHQLIELGVLCSLKQLLEDGYFHADPHPGNLLVTKEGRLAYFDFGMMSQIQKRYRIGLISTLVHFVNRDAVGLCHDFERMGFLPPNAPFDAIVADLKLSFGDKGSRANLDFQGIMNQLSSVMYKFQFRLPAVFSMVIRALGSLEGTATTLDPEFKVIASAYPFVVGRLLSDPNPEMRQILFELLIRKNGSFRWHRLERMVMAIKESQKNESEGGDQSQMDSTGAESKPERNFSEFRRAFDQRIIVGAVSDLFDHIFSDRGQKTRAWIVRDSVLSADKFVEESFENFWQARNLNHGRGKVYSGDLETTDDPKLQGSLGQESESEARLSRSFEATYETMKAAPELWIPLLAKTALRNEARTMVSSIAIGLTSSLANNASENVWVALSNILRKSGA